MGNTVYAPGNRVVIRDAEWLVKNVVYTADRACVLDAVGLSELVKDKQSKFIVGLEKEIIPIDPKDVRFTQDVSPGYRDSLLYMESLLRKRAPKDGKIHVGDKAAIDPIPFQMEPAFKALQQHRQRILIADAVGLGKTIECGVLVSELIKRGRGKRILVLAVKSMLTQFQKEMWTRFTIPLVRLDSQGIQRVKQHIPAGHNPFLYFDKSIISIDTLKREAEYRHYLEHAWWDIIIIDEAHNVAERGTNSMRSKLAKLISGRSDTLIMLSATPHDGKKESFASLMNMLDSTAIADPSNYGPEDIKGLFIRRFKKDIKAQVTSQFKERTIEKITTSASEVEEQAFDLLSALSFKRIDARVRAGSMLFKTVLIKSLFSSPAACIKTCRNRIKRLKNDDYSEYLEDILQLEDFIAAVEQITKEGFSKYRKLANFLKKNDWGWNRNDPHDRLVIFTERIETLKFLKEELMKDLKFKEKQIGILYGSMSDSDIQQVVEDFGNEQSPLQVLIASDVASEGINLHYQSHRLIHFDIPWSLMVFQQRNGRIDRYGQDQKPQIFYLLTESDNDKIKGDQRVLELLIEKDQQVHESIGDPAEFTGKYTSEEEELLTASAIESDNGAAELEQTYEQASLDPMSDLLSLLDEDAPENEDLFTEGSSFFSKDYDYIKQAIAFLKDRQDWSVDYAADGHTFLIQRDEKLKKQFSVLEKTLPAEIIPAVGEKYIFTDHIEDVKQEMERCRKEETAWPKKMLLWDQNPFVSWITDRLQTVFGRNEAPYISVPSIQGQGDTIVLLSGMIPNIKGQPVVEDWFGIVFDKMDFKEVISINEFMDRTGLGKRELPNPQTPVNEHKVKRVLPESLEIGKQEILRARERYKQRINPQIMEQIEKLKILENRQYQFTEGSLYGKSRKEREFRRIARNFAEYTDWIKKTLNCGEDPFLRVICMVQEAE
jgi:superfamily II DNA or RNA helicase